MSDYLIIGGGIIGLLTARELAAAGASVTLLDKRETGRESSWAGGGIVSPLYPWRYADSVTELAAWSQQRYAALCDELHEDSGIDPEYTRSGLLILDTDEADTARGWAKRRQIDLQTIESDDIGRIDPGIASAPDNAFWFPDVAQIRNPRLAKAARLSVGRKVNIIEHAEVTELRVSGGKIRAVRCGDDTYNTDKVIVCAGAWTGQILGQLGEKPDIRPIRGQMILFNANPGDVRRIVLQQDRYAIPRRDGRVLMGSTLEDTGFVKATTDTAREELYRRATALYPALKNASIEKHWSGLRPASPSGIPYIGAYPEIEGLYFNAGHFRNGVVLGPASARLMADIVLDRSPTIDPAPYTLAARRDTPTPC